MQVDGLSTGSIDPHRRIAVFREEEMAMVGGDDRFADANTGQALQATCQVLHNSVHDPSRIERAGVLAGPVDFSGAHYDDLGVANLLLKCLGVRGQNLVKRQIG